MSNVIKLSCCNVSLPNLGNHRTTRFASSVVGTIQDHDIIMNASTGTKGESFCFLAYDKQAKVLRLFDAILNKPIYNNRLWGAGVVNLLNTGPPTDGLPISFKSGALDGYFSTERAENLARICLLVRTMYLCADTYYEFDRGYKARLAIIYSGKVPLFKANLASGGIIPIWEIEGPHHVPTLDNLKLITCDYKDLAQIMNVLENSYSGSKFQYIDMKYIILQSGNLPIQIQDFEKFEFSEFFKTSVMVPAPQSSKSKGATITPVVHKTPSVIKSIVPTGLIRVEDPVLVEEKLCVNTVPQSV